MSASYKELLVIDGEPIEFELNFLPGFSSLQLLQKIQNDLRERNIEPENRPDHLHVKFQRIQKESRNTRRYSRRDTGRSSVLETKKKW